VYDTVVEYDLSCQKSLTSAEAVPTAAVNRPTPYRPTVTQEL